MSHSNISGKVSVLISSLLVAVLLIWQFQLPDKSTMEKPVKKSQQAPPRKPIKSLAVAAFALPPPPAIQKKQPVRLMNAVTIKKPPTQKKKKPIVKAKKAVPTQKKKIPNIKIKKPSPKKVAVRADQKTTPRKLRPRTVRVSVTDRSPEAKEGRTLLRLLEHGSGPTIEIAWPDGNSARSSLYHLLRSCYGMRTALMNAGGSLYVTDGDRNWRPDMDRFSGFVRQPSGALPAAENKEVGAIRRRHGLGPEGTVVRLFPRNVDAILLGGLRNILVGRYQNTKIIHAAYRRDGSRLMIDNITADGISVRGRIAFSAALAKCG